MKLITYVCKRPLHDLTQLIDLFFATTDIIVSYVWFFFDFHHCDRRIDFGRQWDLNLEFFTVHTTQSN